MLHSQLLIIFTDGGARGNPGPAGIGAVLYSDETGSGDHRGSKRGHSAAPAAIPSPSKTGGLKKVGQIKEYIGEQTNNFAEYSALISALEKARELGYKDIRCYLDSELVVNQLNGRYKVREQTLKSLAARALALTNKFKSVSFHYIPRQQNREADKLVNQAIDQAFFLEAL